MTIESFIETYGYAAILIGTFLEGETILVLGGFAAHRGYLSLPWVIVAAFAGTLSGEWHNGEGQVFLNGELWKAVSDVPLFAGDKVLVQEVAGLTLKVKPLEDEKPSQTSLDMHFV